MPRLPLPSSIATEKLADWLEIYAILSGDKNSSKSDLERVLQSGGVLEVEDPDAIEKTCLAAFAELEDRQRAATEAYPFQIDGALLTFNSRIEDLSPYVFCLCLSYLGWERGVPVARWFERFSTLAAKNFLGGEAARFASPREELPRQFRHAVHVLCQRMGEGGGWRPHSTLRPQDDTLDVVAWRHFPDQLPGKLVLFGQCAAGFRLSARKVRELDPRAFHEEWMLEPPVSPIIKAFFTPHRLIGLEKWNHASRAGGILFDRCRIAYWCGVGAMITDGHAVVDWIRTALRRRPQ